MRLNELNERSGAHKNRKRVGRGMASGTGKTSGKGHKGQKSRSGVSLLGFEGGQMPLFRRLPKRGFKNPFSKDHAELTLASLDRAITSGKIDPKNSINEELLRAAGVVRKSRDGVRLLATGELKSKVTLIITGATMGAIAAVEKIGGSVTVIPKKPKPEGKGKKRHRKFNENNTENISSSGSSDVKIVEPKNSLDSIEEDKTAQEEG
jgi:large subunit ribosomal protein L15